MTMTASELEARPKQKVERRESTRPGAYFQPAVDIFETPEELVVVADMPGVPPDAVDVDLEGDELSIEGRVRTEDYKGLKPLHVEYVTCRNYQEVAAAIRDMIIRGAPAIGVAAAMGVAIGIEHASEQDLDGQQRQER